LTVKVEKDESSKTAPIHDIDKYGEDVRNRVKPKSLGLPFKDAVEKDKTVTMQFVTGCFIGCVLPCGVWWEFVLFGMAG